MSRSNENRPHGSSAPNMHEDSRSDDLRALYLNARSFLASVTTDYDCSIKVAKSTLLQQLVYGGDFDVIGVCQTWLKSTIVDGEILPSLSTR